MTTVEQNAPTFQDVWRMFQENALSFKETERLMKERSAETGRLMKESSAETNRKFQETGRLMKESAAETERLMKESAAETERIVKTLSKKLGDLGNRLGEFVEHMVAPAVVRLFQAEGIEVHTVPSRL